jgi:hypothetical protein
MWARVGAFAMTRVKHRISRAGIFCCYRALGGAIGLEINRAAAQVCRILGFLVLTGFLMAEYSYASQHKPATTLLFAPRSRFDRWMRGSIPVSPWLSAGSHGQPSDAADRCCQSCRCMQFREARLACSIC